MHGHAMRIAAYLHEKEIQMYREDFIKRGLNYTREYLEKSRSKLMFLHHIFMTTKSAKRIAAKEILEEILK